MWAMHSDWHEVLLLETEDEATSRTLSSSYLGLLVENIVPIT